MDTETAVKLETLRAEYEQALANTAKSTSTASDVRTLSRARAAWERAFVSALGAPEVLRTEPLLQLFAYSHLPPDKQDISRPFGELAQYINDTLPRNPERTTALRKLREAKDCAVTASIWKENG